MAKIVTIPIENHEADGVCTSYYALRLRLEGEPAWQVLPNQYENPIVLYNLLDDEDYELEVTRHCCDEGAGTTSSTPVVLPFTSTDT